MDFSLTSNHTAEASESVDQVVRAFSEPLVRRARAHPPFQQISKLAIFANLMHPLGSTWPDKRGFSRASRFYGVTKSIDYHRWAVGSWSERVDLLAETARQAIGRIPATRLSGEERAMLLREIEATRLEVGAAVPKNLTAIRPAYVS
jgi:hypothetical protein